MPETVKEETRSDRVRRASRERREFERGALRRRILDAAAELILGEGYEQFSLRKLAEQIGYSATTIYRHYADKDDLVCAVVDRGFEIFGAELARASERAVDPRKRIKAIGQAYIRFGLANPIYYQLMFMRPPEGQREIPARSVALRRATFVTLLGAVEAAMAAGAVRKRDPEIVSTALWALVHGIVALSIVMGERHGSDAVRTADVAVAAILQGLG